MSEQRWQTAKRLRDSGMLLREVAAQMGVSTERVRQLLAQGMGLTRRGQRWTDGLSTRAANCLLAYGFKDRAGVAERLGDIHLIGGVGKRSAAEIRRWLTSATNVRTLRAESGGQCDQHDRNK